MKSIQMIALCAIAAIFSACQKESDSSNLSRISEKQSQRIKLRVDAFWKLAESNSPDSWDKLEEGTRALRAESPSDERVSELMILVAGYREKHGELDRARILAKEEMNSSAPERYKLWANGFLHRLDSMGKVVTIKFTAVDGREVDLANMKGKVVLVDFWSTGCAPCVAEMPRVKAAFEKLQDQGFEVIGINCDSEKKDLENFVAKRGITWPQYFDGKQQQENKFTLAFGINGMPHMFLVDKKGCLRVDHVRAKGGFEEQIAALLAEH